MYQCFLECVFSSIAGEKVLFGVGVRGQRLGEKLCGQNILGNDCLNRLSELLYCF